MLYKLSMYNYGFELNGEVYIFNTYRLGLAQVGEEIYKLLQCNEDQSTKIYDFSLRSPQEFVDLLEGGFILEYNMDEGKRMWYHYIKSRFISKIFSITIIPTNACNLNCGYCYQNEKSETMTLKVQEQLINFIKDNLRNKNVLSVTWYGGEPLLAMPIIYNLSKKFIAYCEKEGIEYHARLVTNGTLLTKEIVTKLVACSIQQAQITIDGPKETHDNRRPFKGFKKGSSYKKIIEGLGYIKGRIPVSIRVNIDQINKNSYLELMADLDANGLLNNDISVGLGYVRPWTEGISHIQNNCINMDEFSELELEFLTYRYHKDIRNKMFPDIGGICRAVGEDDYVIDPLGNLLKCWIHVNNEDIKDVTVGDIFNGVDYGSWKLLKWLTYDPLNNEKCSNCVFFPICLGGCPYIQLQQPGRFNEICDYWKHHLIKSLSIYIKDLKETEACLHG